MTAKAADGVLELDLGLKSTDPIVHELVARTGERDYDQIALRLKTLEQRADASQFLRLSDSEESQESGQELVSVSATETSKLSSPGPIELGPYILVRLLGIGGFSRVYEAYHRSRPSERVAVKLFQHRWLDALERLEIEKLVLQELNHPNLVKAIDSGETPDGMSYLVMTLVEGERIDEFVRSRKLDYRAVANLFAELADAMAYAHERDVIHRDLKPSNILVTNQGHPVIADFGLAKRVSVNRGQSLTATGALVGTLGYLAPEQVGPSRAGISRAVDIYGLGATLYSVLTGEAPTENENLLQGLNQLQHQRPAEPRSFDPNLPLNLQLICLKCLEKSPRDRYDSMWELAADFRRFHSGQRVLARPPATWTQFYRWVQANKLVASLSMGLLLAVVLGLSVTLFLWRQAEARRAQANGLLRSANAILSKGNKLAEDSLAQTAGSFSYRYDRLHQSVGFLQQIAEEFPSDFDLQRELATTHFRLAKVSGRRGFYDEGIENFIFAETLFRQLSELQPEDVSLRFDVFHSLLGNHHLCEVSRLEGYQHEKLFAAQAVIEEVLAAEPNNIDYRDAYICSLSLVASKICDKDLEKGLGLHKQLHEEAMKLKADLPEPCLQWRHAGLTASNLVSVYYSLGDLEEARYYYLKAERLIEEYLAAASEDPLEQMDWITVKRWEFEFALRRKDVLSARRVYEQIRQRLVELIREYPDYYDFHRYLAEHERDLKERIELTGGAEDLANRTAD
jgi:serine/threonine protein kinase